MPTTPAWQAARNGLPGNLNATNQAAQTNQFLGSHPFSGVYAGSAIVTPSGGTGFVWLTYGTATDIDQPFVLPAGQTAIGRVTVPVTVYGQGADLLAELWPDNGAGLPNTTGTPLAATLVPAAWFLNLSATTGVATGGPLATPQYNSTLLSGDWIASPWLGPAGSANGVASYSSPVTSGNFGVLLGGYDFTAGTALAHVNTVQYLGGGTIGQPQAQPPLPQATFYGAAAAGTDFLLYAGGETTTPAATASTAVWVAGWDPNTGKVSQWSAQAALPVALSQSGAAAWGNTVYLVGGTTNATSAGAVNTVYVGTVSNGQLNAWAAGPPLPQPLSSMVAAVVGDWLIVAGGATSTAGVASNATYYALIHPDGSLGGWQTGPTMPLGVSVEGPGWDFFVTDSALVVVEGWSTPGTTATSLIQILSASADGLGEWHKCYSYHASQEQVLAFPTGNGGVWDAFILRDVTSQYYHAQVWPVPTASIPLPATGLTAGATYHVLLRQNQSGSVSDYLGIGIHNYATATGESNGLTSARYANVWTAITGTWSTLNNSWSVPVTVFDRSQTGHLLHAWQDPDAGHLAAATDTRVDDFRGRMLGHCEATAMPNNPLDSNPTFTTGVAPWTAVGGTITQSSAQTHGGYPYSGLLTPNGTAATVYAASELLPVVPGRWYTANGWLYSTPGYTNVSLSVNWFDHAGTYLSTSSSTVSLTAATWTQVTNIWQAPAGAAQAALVPTEGGTPTTADVLYLSYVTLTATDPTVLPSVSQVVYGQGLYPPTAVVQHA